MSHPDPTQVYECTEADPCCDCPKCCEHQELDHGICMDCGADESQGRAFMRAEAAAEGDR